MLNFFRQKGLANLFYGVIIVGTICTFVIEFRPNAGAKNASLSETCVARIRGRCIDPKDFGSAYRILMPAPSSQLSRRLSLRRIALDGLIERELLDDEAKRLGITVSDEEVTDELYNGFVRVSVPAADPVGRAGGAPRDVPVVRSGGPHLARVGHGSYRRARHGHSRRLSRRED